MCEGLGCEWPLPAPGSREAGPSGEGNMEPPGTPTQSPGPDHSTGSPALRGEAPETTVLEGFTLPLSPPSVP